MEHEGEGENPSSHRTTSFPQPPRIGNEQTRAQSRAVTMALGWGSAAGHDHHCVRNDELSSLEPIPSPPDALGCEWAGKTTMQPRESVLLYAG
jgi:hypothetical protein